MCYEYLDSVKPQTLKVKKLVEKKLQKAVKANSRKVQVPAPILPGYQAL